MLMALWACSSSSACWPRLTKPMAGSTRSWQVSLVNGL
jgi:hypothetical protein